MRIWIVGGDDGAIRAIEQLRKIPEITIVVSSPLENPKAVVNGVIAKVDHVERVTPVNVNELARRIHPDLILIDPAAVARNYARLAAGMAFSAELTREIAAVSIYPCLIL